MPPNKTQTENEITADFLSGKTAHSLDLFNHFITIYKKMGATGLYPAKSMIGIAAGERKVAWITQLGKNFIHVVLPFSRAYPDNFCFQKIAQVPGRQQFNHHLRIHLREDLNEEVRRFMAMSLEA
jgi:hypothetical protein